MHGTVHLAITCAAPATGCQPERPWHPSDGRRDVVRNNRIWSEPGQAPTQHTAPATSMPLPGSNPLAPVTVAAFSRRLVIAPDADNDHRLRPLLSLSPPQPPTEAVKEKDAKVAPLTKEEVARATWMLLHTVAGQFPVEPTRQQKQDAKELMHILSRLYPCKECGDHSKEVLKANPVQAGSQAEFSQWLCYVHNVVNRSLGKPIFPCQRVNARWGKLDLEGSKDTVPDR